MTATAETTAAEFVDYFAEGWSIGARDPEAFFAHFDERLHPDATMIQPIAAPTRGPASVRELFTPLFRAVPDLRGEVLRWGETADGVIVELRLRGTLGGRPLEWTTADRIVLEDGLLRERRAYFDTLPLLKALAMRPRASLPLLSALLRRKESR